MGDAYISKEQFYKSAHISKRTALWLIQTGLVPAIDTGKATCRYLILQSDVDRYMEERQLFPEKYSRSTRGSAHCYASKFKKGTAVLMSAKAKDLWQNEADLLTVQRIAYLLGYNPKIVSRWLQESNLQYLTIDRKIFIPKLFLLQFIQSEAFHIITPKSKKHIELIRRATHEGE